MTDRYDAEALNAFAADLFSAAGMPPDRARIVAELLVEGDLIGQTTHGLAQAGPYLGALADGGMKADGEPEVVSDRGAAVVWNGQYLSGVWLVSRAMQEGFERVSTYGTVTYVIRHSHHIACLAAFLHHATDRGLMMTLASSDPANDGVAPFGSYQPVYTPDPIAVGIPTAGDPVLIDISASTSTLGMVHRLIGEGGRMPGPWLIDNQGRATDDPTVINDDPPGALMPLGGLDRGHKGFGLGLMIEALTAGLGGYGRADRPSRWGAAVYLQLIDPDAFGGGDAFRRETGYLAEACRAAAVPAGSTPVRLPGDGALARKRAALADGLILHPSIMPELTDWAQRLNVAPPKPV